MEVNLYQSLECRNYVEINQQIFQHINHLGIANTTTEFWNPVDTASMFKAAPLFLEWTIEQNLKIKTIAVTVGKQLNCCGIHIDTPPARYKLSWPVLNADQTYNRWFKEIGPCEPFINNHGGKTYPPDSKLIEIQRRTLSGPAIIDAGIPHDVQFHTIEPAYPRIVLQCQLFNEPKSL